MLKVPKTKASDRQSESHAVNSSSAVATRYAKNINNISYDLNANPTIIEFLNSTGDQKPRGDPKPLSQHLERAAYGQEGQLTKCLTEDPSYEAVVSPEFG